MIVRIKRFFRIAFNLFYRTLFFLMFVFASNSLYYILKDWRLIFPALFCIYIVNLLPGFTDLKITKGRLSVCNHGVECLLIFLSSGTISFVIQIWQIFYYNFDFWQAFYNILVCVIVHSILFWNGLLSVYCTSYQLGVKHRILGIVFAWLFPLNLIILGNIIRIVILEKRVETEKVLLNSSRKNKEVCKTKYPILLVHGFFFRDNKHLNYWGRIPDELRTNGATVYYGEHSSALAVEDSAVELKNRIEKIMEATGAEKFNIIAHSKGGLDCRYAIKHLGLDKYTASLTTVSTPHRGCPYATKFLKKIPKFIQKSWSKTYNTTLYQLGDPEPDFMAGVNCLTDKSCAEMFDPDDYPKEIFCQSIGTVLKKWWHAPFPLNIACAIVKHYDGINDGLVPLDSFKWGEKYTLLTLNKRRGISHMDIVDLTRKNINGFDVREFYVQLVADLKNRGL